jgi:integrase
VVKVFGYTRVSTDEQVRGGVSLEMQRERIASYAASQGWRLVRIFEDAGHSGTTLERPALQKMLSRLDKVSAVIVFKVDRISRKQRHLLTLLEEHFEPHRVGFVSVVEPFDTVSPMGRAMLGMLGVFAQLRLSRRPLPLWTPAELRRFLLAAPELWRPVWLVAVFAGLRPGELQAMAWTKQNWPDFTVNKIHITTSYEARTKVLGAPKTDRSIRDVDMVPTVRRVLEALPSRADGALVFPGADGGVFSRDKMRVAWVRTIAAVNVRALRPYDLRHTFASLLIAVGKNPLYVARQMGHYSAGFTLDTYGHLMDSLPQRQVEWIDEIVFPEGLGAALKLHLSGAPSSATEGHAVQPPESSEPLQDNTSGNVVQSGTAGYVVPPARFELALPA